MRPREPEKCERCNKPELRRKLLDDEISRHVSAMTCEHCGHEHPEWIETHHEFAQATAQSTPIRQTSPDLPITLPMRPAETTTTWAVRVVACGVLPAIFSVIVAFEITLGNLP